MSIQTSFCSRGSAFCSKKKAHPFVSLPKLDLQYEIIS